MTGNLTADPELRSLPSGTSVCQMRIACNTRRKNASTGEWEDKPNYFNVTVWGAQGENVARYLSKRQATDIIADSVQFLGSRDDAPASAGASSAGDQAANGAPRGAGTPVDE